LKTKWSKLELRLTLEIVKCKTN